MVNGRALSQFLLGRFSLGSSLALLSNFPFVRKFFLDTLPDSFIFIPFTPTLLTVSMPRESSMVRES